MNFQWSLGMHKSLIEQRDHGQMDDVVIETFQLHSFRTNSQRALIGLTSIRFGIVCLLRVNSNYCIVSQATTENQLLLLEGCLKNCFDLIVKMPRGRRTSPSLYFQLCLYTNCIRLQHTHSLSCTNMLAHVHTHT